MVKCSIVHFSVNFTVMLCNIASNYFIRSSYKTVFDRFREYLTTSSKELLAVLVLLGAFFSSYFLFLEATFLQHCSDMSSGNWYRSKESLQGQIKGLRSQYMAPGDFILFHELLCTSRIKHNIVNCYWFHRSICWDTTYSKTYLF